MAVGKSLYDVLEVARTASPEVIDASHKRLREKFDPDLPENSSDDLARIRFRAISEAYVTLSNPDRRREYDTRLRALDFSEVVQPFWTPTRLIMVAVIVGLVGTSYWKYQSAQVAAELARIAIEKERLAQIERQRQEVEAARQAEVDQQKRDALIRQQDDELARARALADYVERNNSMERDRYERQVQGERQREEAARERERLVAAAAARKRAIDDENRLRQLEYERQRGR